MEEIKKLLGGVFYLATAETNGQPHVRPFDGAVQVDGKWYFETTNNKAVYQQLRANPAVEIVALDGPNMVRLSANVDEVSDEERAAALTAIGKYPPGEPTAAVFRLENARGSLTENGQTSPIEL